MSTSRWPAAPWCSSRRPVTAPISARRRRQWRRSARSWTASDRRRAVTAEDPLTPDSAEDLYENAPCGYLSTLPDGRIARVNQTFLTWTGYTRDQLVGQRRFVELLTPGGRIYHETHYAPLLQMQGTVRAIALDVVRADGSRMPVLVNSQLRADSAGGPIGVRHTVFDATDRRRYETELLAARRRAEQATAWVRAVEQVVADLA